jgi:hypothetical protein
MKAQQRDGVNQSKRAARSVKHGWPHTLILAAPRLVCKTVGAGVAVTIHYSYPAQRGMRYAVLCALLFPEIRALGDRHDQ